jgi:hypothetical protein
MVISSEALPAVMEDSFAAAFALLRDATATAFRFVRRPFILILSQGETE